MKIFKKVLKSLFILLLSFVLLSGALIAWIVANPQRVWKIVEEHFLPEDLNITWSEMKFQWKHETGFNFYLEIEFHDLYVKKKEPVIDFPVQFLGVKVSVSPRNLERKLLIHDLKLSSKQDLFLKLTPPKSEDTPKNPFETFQNIMRLTKKGIGLVKVENLDLKVQRFILEQGEEKRYTMCLDAVQNHTTQPDILDYKLCFKTAGRAGTNITSKGRLNLSAIESNELQLQSSISLSTPLIRTTQSLKLDYIKNTTNITSRGPLVIRTKKSRWVARPSGRLTMTPSGVELDLKVAIQDPPGTLVKIPSAKIHISSPFERNVTVSQRASNVSILFPIQIFFIDKDMQPPLMEACQCKIPEMLIAKVEGRAWLSNLILKPSRRTPFLDLRIRLDDVRNKLLSLNSAAELKVFKEVNKYFLYPVIDAQAQLHSFQGLKNFLDAKKILVPAPFDVLEGTVYLKVKGPIKTDPSGYTFPAVTNINLSSGRQIVDVRGQAQIQLKSDFKSAKVDVQTFINQLQFELPPLSPVQGRPRVILDKRIMKEPPPPPRDPSRFKLDLNVGIVTTHPGSIHLLSPYFEPHLPLTMDIHVLNGPKNSGIINTEPFNINYLRRKVFVEKMVVDLSRSQEKTLWIDGKLKVEQTQYVIFIEFQGPANSPQVILTSTPYLSRSEIISVLLYDRTSEQLASGDAETAGNVEAAIVDRAVGLFSLWVFASTPIKGFSYSPSTKMYKATIEVSHDVTASIGTNWETATQVELRKRISNRWMLTASWTPAGQDEAETTKLVLQWENRF